MASYHEYRVHHNRTSSTLFVVGALALSALSSASEVRAPSAVRAFLPLTEVPTGLPLSVTIAMGALPKQVSVRDGSGKILHDGPTPASGFWEPGGTQAATLVLDSLPAGSWWIHLDGVRQPDPLMSRPGAFGPLLRDVLRFYYLQRASVAIPAATGGRWARPAGHPDTVVHIHPQDGAGVISSPGGWYDAGDYGKYVVNSNISVWTLLDLAEAFPAVTQAMDLGIPESGGPVPDVLAEVRYNLAWMLTMQAADGGVRHKLTTLQFPGMKVLPYQDTASRWAFMRTTAATRGFAAVAARAARVYATADPGFAAKCRTAALSAWAWAEANPAVPFRQPPDAGTGEYGDEHFDDERYWAAAELWLTTGDSVFLKALRMARPRVASVPNWQSTGMLGTWTIARHAARFPKADAQTAIEATVGLARFLGEFLEASPWKLAMQQGDFVWGSNSVVANQGIALLQAHLVAPDPRLHRAARVQLDYLLGRNPHNRGFVTGYGARSPLHPHHRPSEGDTHAEPWPGMLVGGPQPGGQDMRHGCPNYLVSGRPALSWIDHMCSYASNEVTINWNAPLAWMLAAFTDPALLRGEAGHRRGR